MLAPPLNFAGAAATSPTARVCFSAVVAKQFSHPLQHTVTCTESWDCKSDLAVLPFGNCLALSSAEPVCSAEATFSVDVGQLEARYKRLQKDLHPDKFGNQEARAQKYSAEQSSLVNRAYVKLKSPLQRALYLVRADHKCVLPRPPECFRCCLNSTATLTGYLLCWCSQTTCFNTQCSSTHCTSPFSISMQLERKGQPVPEDGGTISDPALLMEVMEQRELVEETEDASALQEMLAENRRLEQATTEVSYPFFHSGATLQIHALQQPCTGTNNLRSSLA